MVVLQVLPSLVTGGVERGTLEIAEAVARAGGVSLVASAGGPLVAALRQGGSEHVTLKLAAKDPLGILGNARRLERLIRERGVQLVHARSRAPAWSAWLAARRAGVAFVTTYHGVYRENLPFKRRYNAVMAKGDRVIAASRFVARLIEVRHAVDPARIRHIPRGVDPAVFDPDAVPRARLAGLAGAWRVPEGMAIVLLPGRLSRWKGHAVLIEAVARLPRRDVCLVLLGPLEGRRAYAARLIRHAGRLGLGERLRLPGGCADMPAAMRLADVVVHASTEPEAFGRVVIEAQAMGRPVIAADLGGPAETVEEGSTGWLVPPGDPAALAAALGHVLGLPAPAREEIGTRARAAVLERHTTAAMQAATLAVYRELLG